MTSTQQQQIENRHYIYIYIYTPSTKNNQDITGVSTLEERRDAWAVHYLNLPLTQPSAGRGLQVSGDWGFPINILAFGG